MAAPQSLLGEARAFARDYPRDRMPRGYLWDVVDYVPVIIDAGLTGRGGWVWASNALGGDATAGILAAFTNGEKLLTIGSNKQWYEVDQTTQVSTARGAAYTAKQNPVQWVDKVVAFDGDGLAVPQLLSNPGGSISIGAMHASAPKAPYGISYGAYIVVGGTPGEESMVRYSYPNDPTAAWDSLSRLPVDNVITGLASLRSVVIVFHAGSVERIRGATPTSASQPGDIFAEHLFDRVGCTDPKSIAYWNDNCVFADEHGVHLTDGAVIRNIVSQGGIQYFWRTAWGGRVSVAGCTFLDYYIVTIRRSDGSAITLCCDLNKRQWFRFANVYALSYWSSTGGTGMERIWAGMAGTSRLGRVSPCFFPTFTTATIADADGTAVLPSFETPWYRQGREALKRSRFGYLSYDVRTGSPSELDAHPSAWRDALEAEHEGIPPLAPPEVMAAVAPVLQVDYVTSPSSASYTSMGALPPTTKYSRYKLPINRGSYGIAFRVKQTQPSTVTRVYDLSLEGWSLEPSRVVA